jgi:hypothetical protein
MLKTDEKPMVVYHWWGDNPQVKPYQNMASPIIPSIAVLRAHNRSIPITVLDLSCDPQEWGCFPELLNFKLVRWTPRLDLRLHKSSKLCSRVWDVWEYAKQIKQRNILFTDADIFWLRNPLPLVLQEPDGEIQKFYCSSNTGVWYFDKTSEISDEVIRLWKFIISRVLIGDKDFFDELSVIVPTALERPFQDEVAFGYLLCQHPELYHPVPQEENYMIYRLMNDEPLDNVRCLHGLGAVLGSGRGLICLALKELRDAVERVLSAKQMKMVFGDIVCDQVYEIDEVKTISHQKLKELLEFTKCSRADELIKELKVKNV